MALMRATVGMYRDPATAQLLSGLVAAMARSNRIAHAFRSGFVAHWRKAMTEVLRRAVSRGELPDDTSIPLALDMLSGPLFYRYLMLGKSIDLRFAGDVVATVLAGLTAAR